MNITYDKFLDVKRKPKLPTELNKFRQLHGLPLHKDPQGRLFKLREAVRKFLASNNIPIPHPKDKYRPRAVKGAAMKTKDPTAPKGYRPVFSFFMSSQRDKLCPGLSRTSDVAQFLGDIWGGMTEQEKAPYNTMAENDRKRYNLELEQFKKKRQRLMCPTEAPEDATMKDVAFKTIPDASEIPSVNTDDDSPMDTKGMESGSNNSNVSTTVELFGQHSNGKTTTSCAGGNATSVSILDDSGMGQTHKNVEYEEAEKQHLAEQEVGCQPPAADKPLTDFFVAEQVEKRQQIEAAAASATLTGKDNQRKGAGKNAADDTTNTGNRHKSDGDDTSKTNSGTPIASIETWLRQDVLPDTEEGDIKTYAAVFVALGLDSKAYIVRLLKPASIDSMEDFAAFKPFHKFMLKAYLQERASEYMS